MANSPKVSGIFMVSNGQGLTRIAHTQNLRKRWSEWQGASPLPLHVVAAVATPKTTTDLVQWLKGRGTDCNPMDTRSVHGVLRKTMAHLHVSGEWYALDDTTLSSIERIGSANEDGQEDTWLKVTVSDWCNGGTAWLRECPIGIAEHNTGDRPVLSFQAPLVWQVVGYADGLCSHLVGNVRLDAMTDRIVEWLVLHGQNNIEVIAQFMVEYGRLKNAARDTFVGGQYLSLDAFWDTFPWLVLQGEVTFLRLLTTPTLLNGWWDGMVDLIDFAPLALDQIVPRGPYEWEEYEYLQRRLSNKAHPAEFSGWDGMRLAAEAARHRG